MILPNSIISWIILNLKRQPKSRLRQSGEKALVNPLNLRPTFTRLELTKIRMVLAYYRKCTIHPPTTTTCVTRRLTDTVLIITTTLILTHLTDLTPCPIGITTLLMVIRLGIDRKSTRLNSSHLGISYAV